MMPKSAPLPADWMMKMMLARVYGHFRASPDVVYSQLWSVGLETKLVLCPFRVLVRPNTASVYAGSLLIAMSDLNFVIHHYP